MHRKRTSVCKVHNSNGCVPFQIVHPDSGLIGEAAIPIQCRVGCSAIGKAICIVLIRIAVGEQNIRVHCMLILTDLMQCEDVGSVAWFVHECMERVDSSHSG
jgi:hypothetical protein